MDSGEADLGGFLEAAGRSLEEAQRQLGPGEGDSGIPGAMAIAEVELEAKVTLEEVDKKVALRPISSEAAQAGVTNPDLVSTVRVRYVAVAGETEAGAAGAPQPQRSADEVIDEVRSREDVAPLEDAVEGLEFDATFVPETGDWLVRALGPDDRVVREVLVSDARQ